NVSVKKLYLQLAAAVAAVIVTVHVRETLSLGPLMTYLANPTYEALKIIEFGSSFARMEGLFVVFYNTMAFSKICVLFLAVVYGFTELTNTNDQSRFALVLGMLLAVYSCTIVGQAVDLNYYLLNIAGFAMVFMFYLAPALTLGISAVHSSMQKSEEAKRGAP
ncbi:MAG: hypothetical protein LBC69_02425, partial [Eubacteriaceae bacterium]|nr:hypothetical protein [Eubacteriaceae bacterium]